MAVAHALMLLCILRIDLAGTIHAHKKHISEIGILHQSMRRAASRNSEQKDDGLVLSSTLAATCSALGGNSLSVPTLEGNQGDDYSALRSLFRALWRVRGTVIYLTESTKLTR